MKNQIKLSSKKISQKMTMRLTQRLVDFKGQSNRLKTSQHNAKKISNPLLAELILSGLCLVLGFQSWSANAQSPDKETSDKILWCGLETETQNFRSSKNAILEHFPPTTANALLQLKGFRETRVLVRSEKSTSPSNCWSALPLFRNVKGYYAYLINIRGGAVSPEVNFSQANYSTHFTFQQAPPQAYEHFSPKPWFAFARPDMDGIIERIAKETLKNEKFFEIKELPRTRTELEELVLKLSPLDTHLELDPEGTGLVSVSSSDPEWQSFIAGVISQPEGGVKDPGKSASAFQPKFILIQVRRVQAGSGELEIRTTALDRTSEISSADFIRLIKLNQRMASKKFEHFYGSTQKTKSGDELRDTIKEHRVQFLKELSKIPPLK